MCLLTVVMFKCIIIIILCNVFSGSVYVQVHHSQRLSETPLKCWVITESSGEICCGHCNCMAGLGEVCTHIASLLFYLEALHRLKEVETCTQRQCEWIIPSALKKVEYLPIKDIDFTSARGKKRKLDEMLESDKIITKVQVSTDDTTPTDDDMELLFKNLSLCGTMPAVLSFDFRIFRQVHSKDITSKFSTTSDISSQGRVYKTTIS